MSSGTVNITATGDAIDAGDTAISISGGNNRNFGFSRCKSDKTGTSTIGISGGTFNLTLTGAQSKAISAKEILLSTEEILLLHFPEQPFLPLQEALRSFVFHSQNRWKCYCKRRNLQSFFSFYGKRRKGISAAQNITVNNGNLTITTAGNGATYTNTTGVLDSYSSSAITADGNLLINAGSVTTTSSGTGGKGLKADGTITIGSATGNPVLLIKTTGPDF
jgi:hypothetical protein